MTEPILQHGDCTTALREIPDGSVDLVIADPPYNLGKNYGNPSDSQNRDAYLEFTRAWLTEAARILKPTGALYVFMGFRYISRLYLILEDDLQFQFNGWISWHYTQGMGRTRGFSPRHDDILFFSKTRDFTFNLDAVRIPQKYYRSRNNMRGANPGDVWEFSHVHYCQESRTGHPTQKPEGLMERMVLASSHENEMVVDPFAGSGTTLRVCQQLNRRSLGIELNADYCQLIQDRLAAPFTGFDSLDPRMLRIPKDLTNPVLREEYRRNHKKWFLSNHPQDELEFDKAFQRKYPARFPQTNPPPDDR
ncbi:DNA-methyltransferase [Lignipirellula cremea]|uniref:Methyltransferase n=1 Tax=Lignipirellula cremea TaxID=2528010 RepID=A0A518DX77_9BACT|nr:site-specific DNA-methyltransferase [Lignipirellula cremea]QDU96414.1 Modification methylase RsrI [Lignipirellula cremea]